MKPKENNKNKTSRLTYVKCKKDAMHFYEDVFFITLNFLMKEKNEKIFKVHFGDVDKKLEPSNGEFLTTFETMDRLAKSQDTSSFSIGCRLL